ncbi:HutD/Ves family protein [Caballeronia insecticola]|uniref:HutD family protein n=1 Tax=Caballeronia insecticola TaxID=758793 RepID=R4WYP4_9BURK|nr:HutD family protein [Caballeronia insecticola]BAN26655.1 putative uncharacterized protein [Caballeronia insecticola]
MTVSVIRGAALVASPWKNGGGITREIAACAHAWRASIAEIDRPGPFSRFDGIDRVLVLLDGSGLMLDAHAVMRPFDIARFAGESPIDARLTDGPVRVFNLMTHRDGARASVDLWRTSARRIIDGGTVLLHCAQGPLDVRIDQIRVTLTKTDTLRIDAAHDVEVEVEMQGDGVLLCASLNTEVES